MPSAGRSPCSTCSGPSAWSACSATAASCAPGSRRTASSWPRCTSRSPPVSGVGRPTADARRGDLLRRPLSGWTLTVMKRAARAAATGLTALAAVAARDLMQREHTLLRNFPVLGHARYLLEAIGPELRQYLVAGNNEERPFTRDQRRWVYASAKGANNYFGFGTDNDLEYTAGYPVIKHRTFGRAVPPSHVEAHSEVELPCAKMLGAARGRASAFRPRSLVNISAMSFGSLSGAAV